MKKMKTYYYRLLKTKTYTADKRAKWYKTYCYGKVKTIEASSRQEAIRFIKTQKRFNHYMFPNQKPWRFATRKEIREYKKERSNKS